MILVLSGVAILAVGQANRRGFQHNSRPTAQERGAGEARPHSLTLNVADQGRFLDPESGAVVNRVYSNPYFAFSYPLPPDWVESFKGPPPSETGYYVLSSFKLAGTSRRSLKGTILIAALDTFFVPLPVNNAADLIKDIRASLPAVYKVEPAPAEVRLGNQAFARLDYVSPVTDLHWRVLATEIRCHVVEIVLTGRDPKLLEETIQDMNRMKLPRATDLTGKKFPVCLKDYASGANALHQVEPVMIGPRYTTAPVRFVIGADGRVKHIHVINAFPEQAHSVENALRHWVFKPYIRNGAPTEVETGILFKFPPDSQKDKLPPVKEKY